MQTDDDPKYKFEDGDDDETPAQKKIADDDDLEALAKEWGLSVDETRKRLGL